MKVPYIFSSQFHQHIEVLETEPLVLYSQNPKQKKLIDV